MLDEPRLAGPVSVLHRSDLRNGLMALVDEQQRVVRQVIEQGRRRLARFAIRKMAGVVLDPVAVADLAHHLDVELRPLAEPLGFKQLAVLMQISTPRIQLFSDAIHRPEHRVIRHHVVAGGINRQPLVCLAHGMQQRIDLRKGVHFVSPQFDPIRVVVVGRKNLDGIADHAECPALEGFAAGIEDLHQLIRDLLARDPLAPFQH